MARSHPRLPLARARQGHAVKFGARTGGDPLPGRRHQVYTPQCVGVRLRLARAEPKSRRPPPRVPDRTRLRRPLVDNHSEIPHSEVKEPQGVICAGLPRRRTAYFVERGSTRSRDVITQNSWGYRRSLRRVCPIPGSSRSAWSPTLVKRCCSLRGPTVSRWLEKAWQLAGSAGQGQVDAFDFSVLPWAVGAGPGSSRGRQGPQGAHLGRVANPVPFDRR